MMEQKNIKNMKNENPFLKIEDEIFDSLYEDIIYLRRLPGTSLNLRQLSEEFGTSRTPVRNVVSKLLQMGLLERTGKRSITIAHMTAEKSFDLYEARLALEPYAGYLAVAHISDKELETLGSLVKRYAAIVNAKEVESIYDHALLDHEFHLAIVTASHNPYIQKMYAQIEKSILHYRCCLIHEVSYNDLNFILKETLNHHIAIYHACKFHMASVVRDELLVDIEGMLKIIPAMN